MSEQAEKVTLTFDNSNFQQEVLHSDVPVLVDFWAEWCGPCRMLGPTIDALAEGYKGKVKVGKLNIDENSQVAQKFGIRSIPTVMLFAGGEVQETFVGVRPQQDYQRRLDEVVQS